MSGFLYFVPNTQAVGDAALRRLSIGGIDPRHYEQGQCMTGPGGGSGVMIRASGGKGGMGYNEKAQTWVPGPGKRYWLGYETALRPGPADLERDRRILGEDVELEDGNLWHVPKARLSVCDTPPLTLPHVYGVDADGNATEVVRQDCMALWEAASEYWAVLCALAEKDAEVTMSYDRQFEIVCMALGANYRVGPLEVRALEIVSTDKASDVCDVLVDLRGFKAVMAGLADEESSAEGNAVAT